MREILFRAKRLNDGEWIEGNYAFMYSCNYIMPEDDYSIWYEVNPETICQYTGLTDKNGNKIWENDVVRSTIITERKAKVVYGDFNCNCCHGVYGWTFEPIGEYSEICDIRRTETIEVIGSIFDNNMGGGALMGVKGFQMGHIVSKEVREKISKANDGNFYATCDYCGQKYHTKKSAYEKSKRHFCSRACYSKYRSECMPTEEQNAFGHGYSKEERAKRKKAREILNHYLRDKNLEKQPCEICGEKAEAHHDDYNKPLEVRWLCFKHHREWHRMHKAP